MIGIKRVYEPWEAHDGYRVLVDRLWPRGLRKVDARLDEWLREIAPSPQLRRWFGHEPSRWPEFAERYRLELAAPSSVAHLQRLRGLAADMTLTLLYAAREDRYNSAIVIAERLRRA
jgi:uncharacterized protein YeaO (DUF488 family)